MRSEAVVGVLEQPTAAEHDPVVVAELHRSDLVLVERPR
jgi:hypothetical protein